uniref:ANK_REP_REGION domain-containing protein n=1 Tax=Macrostomum lignano TaxID=282301 RepID=A0A1I8IQ34_9PLAT
MGREIVSKQEFYRRPGSKAWKFKDFQTKELWHEACVLEHVMKELSKCCMEFQKDKERKDKEEEKEKRFRIASTELNEISSEYLYMVQPAFALNYGIIGASEHDFEIEKFIEFENNREKTRFKVESHDVGNMVKCFFLFTGCIRRQIYLLKKFQSQVSPVSNKYLFEVFFQQTQGKTIVDRTEFDVSSDEKVIIDYIDPLDSDNFSDFASKRDFSVLNCSFRCLSLAIKLTIERSTRQNAPAYQAAPVRIEKVKSIDLNLLEKTIITGGNSALKATLKSKKFESSSDAWKILARCVSGGLIETSKALLEKVLEENEDRAPLCDLLMLAADAGQHRLIQHLLEIEVSLDSVTDDDGRTALTRACMTGQVRAAKVLLDHGANALHKDKDTSIQLAEKLGHYQIVRLFDGMEADASKSIALHKLLKEAGFTWQRAKLQQKMADSMEDIVRQIHENNEYIHLNAAPSRLRASALPIHAAPTRLLSRQLFVAALKQTYCLCIWFEQPDPLLTTNFEVADFSCLPEFTRNLLVIRKSRTGSSHLYVNFCCLAWSLRAELLGVTNSEIDAWFSQLQEYPDFEEHMTIAHYSSSKEQVQFCLAKMETILTENRLAFDTRDWDNVERLRNKLKNLVLNEYTTKPATKLPPFKETLLVIAAKKNRSDIVEKLLEKAPAVVSICDVSGRSALSWASFLGHLQPVKVFRRILDENVLQIETNRPDNMRQTPLMLAAHSGHDEVVSELLQMDADLNL